MHQHTTLAMLIILYYLFVAPSLLLFVFLPALLFGDAMELNIRHFRLTCSSAALLAGPGSIVFTFLFAGNNPNMPSFFKTSSFST